MSTSAQVLVSTGVHGSRRLASATNFELSNEMELRVERRIERNNEGTLNKKPMCLAN